MLSAARDQKASEQDLVLRHRYGDEEAFAEIFERFQGLVYNVALRMSGNEMDAQDLAQETFLRVHRHLGKFRGGSTLKTWIYRVTMNLCYSRLGRKRLRMVSIDADDAPAALQVADPRRGPAEMAQAAEERRQVQAGLLQVATPFRQAVVLRDLEGLAYHEIAEVLEINIGTVRSRISRGRAQLKQALENDG